MRIINYAYNLAPELKERIVQYNKLLATYMGYKYFPHNYPTEQKQFDPGWKIHENVSTMTKFNYKINDYLCRNHNDLMYHCDWNWLNSVITELFKRNKYIIYNLGTTAYSQHYDDFIVMNNNAAGLPQFFNTTSGVQNIDDRIIPVWEVVALTVEHLIQNGLAKIPEVKNYRRQIIPGVNLNPNEEKDFLDRLSDLPGKED